MACRHTLAYACWRSCIIYKGRGMMAILSRKAIWRARWDEFASFGEKTNFGPDFFSGTNLTNFWF
jgi:hypothetical protein